MDVRFIKKLGTIVNKEYGADLRTISISDAGDVGAQHQEQGELELAHTLLEKQVYDIVSRGISTCTIANS